MDKIEFLEMFLELYINHFEALKAIEDENSEYVILDIRNAPAAIKKEQIKGATAIAAKDLSNELGNLDKSKTYIVYDWTGGTILGKQALLILYKAGFKAFELAGAFEGWKGMNLPTEPVE